MRRIPIILLVALLATAAIAAASGPEGYYRQPALHGDLLLFVAEGDLWKVPAAGGTATRLTSHPGDEGTPAISPDGAWVAFTARYEGPNEIYVMPLAGGLPERQTWGGGRRLAVTGWTPEGEVLYSTDVRSTLPSVQLARMVPGLDGTAPATTMVPLAQAADGAFDADGTLFFTRLPFQGSHTRRYKGGTAQNIWRFAPGDDEAAPLTVDFTGTSKRPMVWDGRVYFASDRDGTMNLWSMGPDGGDLRQHTRHDGWDIRSPYLEGGRIAYQLGADLRLYDIAAQDDRAVEIVLDTDLDHTRENWVSEPMEFLTAASLAPDGKRVALTARGRVFVAPVEQGRLVEVRRKTGARLRSAVFSHDGKNILALSDATGEVELWSYPADGIGGGKQLTDGGEVLRWQAIPSPDGKYIAHTDKNQRLFVLDVESGEDRMIDASEIQDLYQLAWSPDSRWLAYVSAADNLMSRVKLYGVEDGTTAFATTDRYDSYSPSWSPDGKWLYLLSDRNLVSIVGSPWGSYQPEPYLDRTTRIYHIPLVAGLRSPFAPETELHGDGEDDDEEDDGDDTENGKNGKKGKKGNRKDADDDEENGVVEVRIELDGLAGRLMAVPVPAGNYRSLQVTDKALFFLSSDTAGKDTALAAVEVARDDVEVETVVPGVRSFELSANRKRILLRKKKSLYVIDAKPKKADLEDAGVDLAGWKLSIEPREEWRQMFDEAWRLERDYFYDQGMHGVDWPAIRDKYRPLVERVSSRAELSDLLAYMVSELSALHIFVGGGDFRSGPDDLRVAGLGAVLDRDDDAGGFRVTKIYRHDPDQPTRSSPLRAPGVDVVEDDVITMINGTPALDAPAAGALLRDLAGRQTRLRITPTGGGEARDVIVTPIPASAEADLRYHDWEYGRRLEVERLGEGDIGYVHLRAMGGRNYTEWAREYYPVFTRKGLIVDVRHNRGGNIDSWILGRLLREAWMTWSQRVGQSPTWNMQYAFRGHVVVLCNEFTASDGEAFTEGARRLGIARIIGTRTWGGEIWLTSSNFLADGGIATSAEFGVFGPEGEWLIEGHGVEPDVVVDNLPHATYLGRDAQLEAAVQYLQAKIAEEPVELPVAPEHPDKSR